MSSLFLAFLDLTFPKSLQDRQSFVFRLPYEKVDLEVRILIAFKFLGLGFILKGVRIRIPSVTVRAPEVDDSQFVLSEDLVTSTTKSSRQYI